MNKQKKTEKSIYLIKVWCFDFQILEKILNRRYELFLTANV